MKRLALGIVLILVACAGHTPPLLVAQRTHDALALAQDLEAGICWGVPNIRAIPPTQDKTHCTDHLAEMVGLTDARHSTFHQQLAKAFALHLQVTSALAAGEAVDTGPLTTLVGQMVTESLLLHPTSQVQALTHALQSGAKR